MTDKEFNESILPLYKQMYGVAMGILSDSPAAVDCVQDSMMSIWSKRREIDSDRPIVPYVISTVRNRCIDYLRERRDSNPIANEGGENFYASVGDEAATLANERSTRQLIAETVRQMPDNMRKVVELSVFGELDNAEIQEITGLSSANVRTLLSRGRKELRALLIKYI